MKIFENAIINNKITTEKELKDLFRKLVKRVHPDSSGSKINNESFIQLRDDYELSLKLLSNTNATTIKSEIHLNKIECIHVFLELICSNFPLEAKARSKNVLYIKRINTLNSALFSLEEKYHDLLIDAEKELLELKHNTGMVKQEYKIVQMYFYSYLDFIFSRGLNSKSHIVKEYGNILTILKNRNMSKTIIFINWLLEEIMLNKKLR